jgi:hypothetical protein
VSGEESKLREARGTTAAGLLGLAASHCLCRVPAPLHLWGNPGCRERVSGVCWAAGWLPLDFFLFSKLPVACMCGSPPSSSAPLSGEDATSSC